MRIIADFHLHSAYSRATSREMHLPEIARWGRLKGLSLLGTGDFTHPAYFQEIRDQLEETGNGLLRLKGGKPSDPHFILTAETSHIYTQGGKGRRIHMMIFAPGLAAAEKINLRLGALGNVKSDGRPIFGFSAKDLVKVVLDIEPDMSAGAGPCLDPLVLGLRFPIRLWFPGGMLRGRNGPYFRHRNRSVLGPGHELALVGLG